VLGYKPKKDGLTLGLLKATEAGRWEEFTCLNSLRDVEPGVGLILDDRSVGAELERPLAAFSSPDSTHPSDSSPLTETPV
jgi:hypothetical protein